MDEEDTESDLDKTVIDLTMDDNLVAEFVDFLSKVPEVFYLCLSSSSAGSSAGSLTSSLPLSGIIPHGLLQHGVDASTDSDISLSTGTRGHQGLAYPQLMGTLIRFKKSKLPERRWEQQEEEDQLIAVPFVPSIPFFLSSSGTGGLQKCPLHWEHLDCSMGLKENWSTPVSPETSAACTNWKNLSDLDQTVIKDHLLLCCTPSLTDPPKLPLDT